MFGMIATVIEDSFQKGGYVMWPILVISLVIWLLCIDRLLYMRQYSELHKKVLNAIKAGKLQELGKFENHTYAQLVRRLKNLNKLPISLEAVLNGFKISLNQDLSKNINTISQFIQVAPLLGLLGTVVGMVQTFSNIMLFGIGNPQLMAEGISVAMLTTQAGLTVAFPAMLIMNLIQSKRKRLAAMILKDIEFLKVAPN